MKVSTIIRAIVFLLSLILISNSAAQSSKKAAVKTKGWSNWVNSKCSVTCGNGKISRKRVCLSGKCKGKATAVKKCNAGSCQKWSPWSTFRPCDATCGPGKTVRTRNCIGGSKCKGKASDTQTCNLKPCPVPVDDAGFTIWSKYGVCSDACGGGTQSRNRTCPKGNCEGHLVEIRNCRMKACTGGNCADRRSKCRKSQCKRFWRVCAKTCGRCKGKETVSWGKYGPCSETCGAGMRSRSKGSIVQQTTCIQPKCTFPVDGYSAWSYYGNCSVSCGGGIQKRTRKCLNGKCNKHDNEIRNCRTNVCGVNKCRNRASRRRCNQLKSQCKNASVARICSLTCKKCPAVVNWGEYGPCSVKCGAGLQTRTKGEVKQSITCFEDDCDGTAAANWGPWTESECTVTCGDGIKTNTRKCQGPNDCDGSDKEVVSCKMQRCPPEWADWTSWSACSRTCGGGIRERTRTCKVQLGCQNLVGERSQQSLCNPNLCPLWLNWSSWSECTKTCGAEGTITRQRECSPPGKCKGESSQTTSCDFRTCTDSNDGWSDCSKSCEEGTRSRMNCTSGTCVQEFEGCNMEKCAEVKCKTISLFKSNRYGSHHECCDDASSTPADATCGKISTLSQKRIIGGIDAKRGQWPWMVAVQMTSGFCAGSIISENFVLSAAHCFAFDSGQPMNTTLFRIIPGILLLADVVSATRYKISSTYIHPDYSFPKADIALVKLTENLKFGEIQPICLPHGEQPKVDSTCYVTGWGSSTIPNVVTNHLQELGILNLDRRVCEESYNKHEGLQRYVPFLKSSKGYMCAGSLSRPVDSCSGDSGGPLVCQRCNSCTWYIAGIVSFGPNPCAITGVPGIYSSVQYYEDWILQITGLPKYSLTCSSNP